MTFPLTRSADSSGAGRERVPRGGGLSALFRKELADQLNSNRFLLLFALLAIAGVTGFYGALSTIRDSSESIDFLYLTLFTTSGSNLPSFASFLTFLSPLMGIVLGFDAVSRERSQGTLNRLAVQPIHRDAILNPNVRSIGVITMSQLSGAVAGYLPFGQSLLLVWPQVDGLTVLRRMRAAGDHTPTLLLTAKADIADRVAGLDAGADDYLPKPFSSREFLARVRALLRRRPSYVQEQLTFGDLTLDTGSCLLTCGKESVRLTGKEFQMMELLLRNTGVILSAATFLERIWGFDSDTEINVVWINIAYLRKRLSALGSRVRIQSIRGVGYTLEDRPC